MKDLSPFADILLDWNRRCNQREMPWKGEKDPYLVWLSEVILQQTRVEQGLPYYLRFKEKYPRAALLAAAPEDEVMRLWQGLGYYTRARNLHAAAKHIALERNGSFPSTYQEIRALKGVGPYTAAAIASFVFGEVQAVVDGNVTRLLSRVFGIDEAFDTTAGRKVFDRLAQQLISRDRPGEYNQAIMDLGACVCVPVRPHCGDCPFREHCRAYQENRQEELPVRSKRIEKKERFFYYLFVEFRGELLVSKRGEQDIWKGLYELPLIETAQPAGGKLANLLLPYLKGPAKIQSSTKPRKQLLTHQKINMVFLKVDLSEKEDIHVPGAYWLPVGQLAACAFPRALHLFLQENCLF